MPRAWLKSRHFLPLLMLTLCLAGTAAKPSASRAALGTGDPAPSFTLLDVFNAPHSLYTSPPVPNDDIVVLFFVGHA